MNAQSHSTQLSTAEQRSESLRVALIAFVTGVALVFIAGFSHSATIHNAGHDTRHALSFPCH